MIAFIGEEKIPKKKRNKKGDRTRNESSSLLFVRRRQTRKKERQTGRKIDTETKKSEAKAQQNVNE